MTNLDKAALKVAHAAGLALLHEVRGALCDSDSELGSCDDTASNLADWTDSVRRMPTASPPLAYR